MRSIANIPTPDALFSFISNLRNPWRSRGRPPWPAAEAVYRAVAAAPPFFRSRDHRFFLTRLWIICGLAGVISIDVVQGSRTALWMLAALIGHTTLNVGIWWMGRRGFQQAAWAHALLDLLTLLVLSLFYLTPYAPLALTGGCILLMMGYVSYSHAPLSGALALLSVGLIALVGSLSAATTVPVAPLTAFAAAAGAMAYLMARRQAMYFPNA